MSKKIFMTVIAGVMLLSLTGCGKTLKCSITEEQSGMKMTQTMNVKFKNDKASSVTANIDMKVDKEYQEYMDTFADTLKDEFKDFEENGMSLDIATKDDTIKVVIDANFDKMSDEQKNEIGFNSSDNSYDAIKKSLEDSGYSCK